MRTTYFSIFLAGIALAVSGCANMEHKLGRGINNITEIPRGGELRRSMEQTALFRSPDEAYTTGFIHGVHRSFARTFVGVYEVITAPFPPYDPVVFPIDPVYPDSYKPQLVSDSIFATDTHLGFSGGDIAPWSPGSRFSIFDN